MHNFKLYDLLFYDFNPIYKLYMLAKVKFLCANFNPKNYLIHYIFMNYLLVY